MRWETNDLIIHTPPDRYLSICILQLVIYGYPGSRKVLNLTSGRTNTLSHCHTQDEMNVGT